MIKDKVSSLWELVLKIKNLGTPRRVKIYDGRLTAIFSKNSSAEFNTEDIPSEKGQFLVPVMKRAFDGVKVQDDREESEDV